MGRASGSTAVALAPTVGELFAKLIEALVSAAISKLFDMILKSTSTLEQLLRSILQEIASYVYRVITDAFLGQRVIDAIHSMNIARGHLESYTLTGSAAYLEQSLLESLPDSLDRFKALQSTGLAGYMTTASLYLQTAEALKKANEKVGSKPRLKVTSALMTKAVADYKSHVQTCITDLISEAHSVKVGAFYAGTDELKYPPTNRDEPGAPEKRDWAAIPGVITGFPLQFTVFLSEPDPYNSPKLIRWLEHTDDFKISQLNYEDLFGVIKVFRAKETARERDKLAKLEAEVFEPARKLIDAWDAVLKRIG